jgi:hypothetical protein
LLTAAGSKINAKRVESVAEGGVALAVGAALVAAGIVIGAAAAVAGAETAAVAVVFVGNNH